MSTPNETLLGPLPQPPFTPGEEELLQRRAVLGDESAVEALSANGIVPTAENEGAEAATKRLARLSPRKPTRILARAAVVRDPTTSWGRRFGYLDESASAVLKDPEASNALNDVSVALSELQVLGGRFAELSVAFHERLIRNTDDITERLLFKSRIAELKPEYHLEIVREATASLNDRSHLARSKDEDKPLEKLNESLNNLISSQVRALRNGIADGVPGYNGQQTPLVRYFMEVGDIEEVLDVVSLHTALLSGGGLPSFVQTYLSHVAPKLLQEKFTEMLSSRDASHLVTEFMHTSNVAGVYQPLLRKMNLWIANQVDKVPHVLGLDESGKTAEISTSSDAHRISLLAQLWAHLNAYSSADRFERDAWKMVFSLRLASRGERQEMVDRWTEDLLDAHGVQIAELRAVPQLVEEVITTVAWLGFGDHAARMMMVLAPEVSKEARDVYRALWTEGPAEAYDLLQEFAKDPTTAGDNMLDSLRNSFQIRRLWESGTDAARSHLESHHLKLGDISVSWAHAEDVIRRAEAGVVAADQLAEAVLSVPVIEPDYETALTTALLDRSGLESGLEADARFFEAHVAVNQGLQTNDAASRFYLAWAQQKLGDRAGAIETLKGVAGREAIQARLEIADILIADGRGYAGARVADKVAQSPDATTSDRNRAAATAAIGYNDAGDLKRALKRAHASGEPDIKWFLPALRLGRVDEAVKMTGVAVERGRLDVVVQLADAIGRTADMASIAPHLMKVVDVAELTAAGGSDVRKLTASQLSGLGDMLDACAHASGRYEDAIQLKLRQAAVDVAAAIEGGPQMAYDDITSMLDEVKNNPEISPMIVTGIEAVEAIAPLDTHVKSLGDKLRSQLRQTFGLSASSGLPVTSTKRLEGVSL